MESNEYGILLQNTEIKNINDKSSKAVYPGMLFVIILERDDLYLVKLCISKNKKFETEDDPYVIHKKNVGKLPKKVFDIFYAVNNLLKRANLIPDYKLIEKMVNSKVGDNLLLTNPSFSDNQNVECYIQYIGEVPEIGYGIFFGIILKTGSIQMSYQQNSELLYNYMKSKPSMGILLSVEHFQDCISDMNEMSILDQPIPTEFININYKETFMNFNIDLRKMILENVNFPVNYDVLSLIEEINENLSKLKITQQTQSLPNSNQAICKLCDNKEQVVIELDSCKHTFCLHCLVNYMNRNKQVTCPICKSKINNQQQKHILIQYLAECYDQNILRLAASYKKYKTNNVIFCKTKDCKHKWNTNQYNMNDKNALLLCPLCLKYYCQRCNTMHDYQTPCKLNLHDLCICSNCNLEVIQNIILVVNGCNHKICYSCIISLWQLNISEEPFKCINEENNIKCDNIIDENQLKFVIPKNIFKKKNMKIFYEKQKNPNFKRCLSDKKCYGYFINENNSKNFICNKCNKENCLVCEKIHNKMTCLEYRIQVLADENNTEREKLLEKLSQDEIDICNLLIEKHVSTEIQAQNVVEIKKLYPDVDDKDIYWAVEQSNDLELIGKLLNNICEICADNYSRNNMIDMVFCDHKCCINCFKQYFTHQITERSVIEFTCPFCKKPELTGNDSESEEEITNYFGILVTILKNHLDDKTYKIFEKKVRDRTLSLDKHFKWCIKCPEGFFIPGGRLAVECPSCSIIMCSSCNEIWQEQHMDITCEKFAQWKKDNDPNTQLTGVMKYLENNGIQCPNCEVKYSLTKGGCLHFICSQCKFEFCGGCSKPFLLGIKCNKFVSCKNQGLHAHHPRNCSAYLRDYEIDELKSIIPNLEELEKDVKFLSNDNLCKIPLQKQQPNGEYIDTICNDDANENFNGLCEKHYKEYLCEIIFKNKIDPLPIMDAVRCQREVIRNGFKEPVGFVPPYLNEGGGNVGNEEYRKRCIDIIKNNIPI